MVAIGIECDGDKIISAQVGIALQAVNDDAFGVRIVTRKSKVQPVARNEYPDFGYVGAGRSCVGGLLSQCDKRCVPPSVLVHAAIQSDRWRHCFLDGNYR